MRSIHRSVLAALAGGVIASASLAAGPDVVYSNSTTIINHGVVGGIRAWSFGTNTCNIGNQNLPWLSHGTPGVGWNLYRLYDGRLEQVGMGFVKHACCAAAGSGCGLTCNGQGGNVLGAGCLDVYSASWNQSQSYLGPRSNINAFTGGFGPQPQTTGNAIFKRLQAAEADINATTYPGALYFVEGVYVATGDASNGNAHNNASYRQVLINASYTMSLAGSMNVGIPAITAWRNHGNGINSPDLNVTDVIVDVPGEGRFHAAYKVEPNGDGTWTYTYAIFNLNSDRSAGSFSVPADAAVLVSNVGFHDAAYHSGEVYDNTDWAGAADGTAVVWSTPQPFGSNPNSSALRWGMMNTFWFTADRPPRPTNVNLGLFKPHTPQEVAFAALAPRACVADVAPTEGNGSVDVEDLLAVINAWGPCPAGLCMPDMDGDGSVNVTDLLAVINEWGPCK